MRTVLSFGAGLSSQLARASQISGSVAYSCILQQISDHKFQQKADDAHGQADVENHGAKFAGIAAPGQIPDDKDHKQDEGAYAEGDTVLCEPCVYADQPVTITWASRCAVASSDWVIRQAASDFSSKR